MEDLNRLSTDDLLRGPYHQLVAPNTGWLLISCEDIVFSPSSWERGPVSQSPELS